jgi:TPR repeat protein
VARFVWLAAFLLVVFAVLGMAGYGLFRKLGGNREDGHGQPTLANVSDLDGVGLTPDQTDSHSQPRGQEKNIRPQSGRPRSADKTRKGALLVGVNDYDNRKLEDLKYAERDVEELAKELRTADYEVRLLTGNGAGADRATKANIDKALAEVLRKLTKKDTLLVAIAGHGQQVPVNGDGGREKVEAFFCPRDAILDKPETMVSMSFVLKQLDERGGGTNLVLVDACRNDPSPGRGRGIDGNRVEALPEGTAVLFSCSKGQRAFESAKAGGGHGVFFHFVLEGLRGKARNDRGAVTWDRLVAYVKERVEEEFPKLVPDVPTRQVPHHVSNLALTPVLLESSYTLLDDLREYDRLLVQMFGDTAFKQWATDRVGTWKEAAERGSAAGQVLFGKALLLGAGVEKNEKEAFKWFRRAADQSDARGQTGLGYMYEYGLGVSQNNTEAFIWVRKAAEQGFADAQHQLGDMYELGKGVTKNQAEALKWFRKAADQGDARGQASLGYKYFWGDGVAKDEAEAFRWYRKAAEQGYPDGQYFLGLHYHGGRGVTKDEAEAVRWYRKAADQGNKWGMDALGDMYADGRGVAKDEAEAVKWYHMAANKGSTSARYKLGVMYENGRGVVRSLAEALKWYSKAADRGDEEAINAVRRLTGSK